LKFFSGKENRLDDRLKEQIVEEILLEHYDEYYRLAYSYVHNEADAADIVQNGAYKAIRKSATIQKIEYAKTWVYRIMLNEIFRALKEPKLISFEAALEEKTQEETQGKLANQIEQASAVEDTYEDIDLQRALHSLEPKDKAIVELRYFEDLKLEEIAEILNENVSTVKSRLYRSMKKLRVQLEEE